MHSHKIVTPSEYLSFLSNNTLSLKLCPDKTKGRGVFYSGTEDISPGTILFSSPHLGFSRQPEFKNKFCAECNRDIALPSSCESKAVEIITCSFCKHRSYCSVKCQKLSWYRIHQLECAVLKTEFHSDEPSVLKCRVNLLRSYWLMYWCFYAQLDKRLWGEANNSKTSELLFIVFNSLPAHSDAKYTPSLLKEFSVVATLVEQQLNWIWVKHPRLKNCPDIFNPSLDVLIETLKVFSNNNFSLVDSEMSQIGEATFPVGSLLNHSCQPNCFYSNSFIPESQHLNFTGQVVDGGILPAQSIIALREIKPNEEITIAYIDVIYNKEIRKKKLEEAYHFKCFCHHCLKDNDGRRSGVQMKDPNFLSYRKLLPSASYLDWRHLLLSASEHIINNNNNLINLSEILKKWEVLFQNNANIRDNSLVDINSRCFSAITKKLCSSTEYKNHYRLSSNLLLFQNTLIYHLNSISESLSKFHSIDTLQNFKNLNITIKNIDAELECLPVPIGKDLLVYLNQDIPVGDLPLEWQGDSNLISDPNFSGLVGRIVSASVQFITFQKHYDSNYHPMLGIRLIELGKLWFNLAPSLALNQKDNENWVLRADFLAFYYFVYSLNFIPSYLTVSIPQELAGKQIDIPDAQYEHWASQITLVKDLVHVITDLHTELANLL